MSSSHFSDLTRQRDFMRLWSAGSFATICSQMLMVAVGWQMYDLTGSAWDLDLVGRYQFAPARCRWPSCGRHCLRPWRNATGWAGKTHRPGVGRIPLIPKLAQRDRRAADVDRPAKDLLLQRGE
jgi:hypothetical protein